MYLVGGQDIDKLLLPQEIILILDALRNMPQKQTVSIKKVMDLPTNTM